MIALAFQSLAVWLGQNGRDFCRFQIIDAAARPRLIGIRKTSAHWPAANGSRSATKQKKLRNAASRQLRVPMETCRSFSLWSRKASTSAAVRSAKRSAATGRCCRAAVKRRNSLQVSR